MKYYCELEDYELRYGKPGDAGLDLPTVETFTLAPGELKVVSTGVRVELPEGYYGLLDARSSTGGRKIGLLSRTIDTGYRGNISMTLINHSDQPQTFERGERLAQLIIAPVKQVTLERVSTPEALSESARGTSGYGSTGTKQYN